MSRTNYTRTIYLLCPDQNQPPAPSLQESLLRLPVDVPSIEPEQLLHEYKTDKHKILLFNYDQHQELRQRLSPLRLTNINLETILFNVNRRLRTEDLLSFGHLKGLFYRHDTPELIADNLAEIINGYNRLPRHVSSQLLHHFRHVCQHHNTQASLNLTTRELEILRCLQTGESNLRMAESLFISEFTVKSHLYQIFKKIAVKNRTQAVAWANQNLFS